MIEPKEKENLKIQCSQDFSLYTAARAALELPFIMKTKRLRLTHENIEIIKKTTQQEHTRLEGHET